MSNQPDYASMWPEVFQDLPPSTSDTVLSALNQTADEGTAPSRSQAQNLVDFVTGRISSREFGQRTMGHLADQQETYVPSHAATPAPEPGLTIPEPEPITAPRPEASHVKETAEAPVRILDHEEAAYAFVRGEVTAEEYLRNARMLRSRPA